MLINTLIELHGQNEVEELLRAENRDGYTPLLLAIMRKTPESKEIIEVLLDRGVEVGKTINTGCIGYSDTIRSLHANKDLLILKITG